MNVLLAVLAFLTALIPVADRGYAVYQQHQQQRNVQPAQTQAEIQQPRIVWHNGQWWKWDGQRWWVWTPNPVQLAQGDNHARY